MSIFARSAQTIIHIHVEYFAFGADVTPLVLVRGWFCVFLRSRQGVIGYHFRIPWGIFRVSLGSFGITLAIQTDPKGPKGGHRGETKNVSRVCSPTFQWARESSQNSARLQVCRQWCRKLGAVCAENMKAFNALCKATNCRQNLFLRSFGVDQIRGSSGMH